MPLHLASQNYQSVPVEDEATLELLYHSDDTKLARIRDYDGKRPLDLEVEHPKCLKRCTTSHSMLLSSFLDASIDTPRKGRESQDLLLRLRNLSPWLRRHARGAQFVQQTLMEELASPFHT